ncbi:hypothetical protein BBJ28_00024903 [Nothophytophthora sp. Chile5]|nr:hypothetical protein BBJ28_00024903 [Nothophytophthora sp. Chile5]
MRPSRLSALLAFCDFLENRVHTASLPLFRRMLRDFFSGNEHTLLDFMRLGAQLVSVLPRELTDRNRRVLAAHLLAQQRLPHPDDPLESDAPCPFRYFLARVATKNILWLRDMFVQFQSGRDELLCEFVRRGNEVVSVVPVDIQALRLAPLPPPPLSVITMSYVAPPIETSPTTRSPSRAGKRTRAVELEHVDGQDSRRPKRKATSGSIAVRERVHNEQEVSRRDQIETRETVPRRVLPSSSELERRLRIMKALEEVEAGEPWKSVFHEGLRCPFAAANHPALASKLQAFWAEHARAVWERLFWAPLSPKHDTRIYHQRKRRQAKAQRSFELTVMTPAFKELGAIFFARLDRRSEPHEGWWSRGPVDDLVSMARKVGLAGCLRYLETQPLVRFPVSPGGSRRYASSENGESRSMWSPAEGMLHVLRQIRVFKAKEQRPQKKK